LGPGLIVPNYWPGVEKKQILTYFLGGIRPSRPQ
jgi:hypothetical protein